MRPRTQEEFARRNAVKRVLLVAVAVFFVLVAVLVNEIVGIRSLLPASALPIRGDGEMRIHFLSVGQADCAFVEFPNGETLIVDAGDGSKTTSDKIYRYWKGLGSPECTLILTHIANDHSGGATTLLKTLPIKEVCYPSPHSYRAKAIKEAAAKEGVPSRELSRYMTFGNKNAYAVCISPRSEEEDDVNDCSAVLYLRYAGVGVLLTGDITAQRERLLWEEYKLGALTVGEYPAYLEDTDVLKLAHHGSDSSSCEEWLKGVGASIGIVSCGRGNSYGHPSGEVLKRAAALGYDVYRTDELGNLLLTISPDGSFRLEYGYM